MELNYRVVNFFGGIAIAAATALSPVSSSAELSAAEYRALLTEAKPIIIPPGTLPNTFTIYNGRAYLGKKKGGKTYSTDFYGKNLLDTTFEIGFCSGSSFDLITPMQGTSDDGVRAIHDLKLSSETMPFKLGNGEYNIAVMACVVYNSNSERQKSALRKFKTLCQNIKGIIYEACARLGTDSKLSLYGPDRHNEFYVSGDKILPVRTGIDLVAGQIGSIDSLLGSLPSSDQTMIASKPTTKIPETQTLPIPAEEKKVTIDGVVEGAPVVKATPLTKPTGTLPEIIKEAPVAETYEKGDVSALPEPVGKPEQPLERKLVIPIERAQPESIPAAIAASKPALPESIGKILNQYLRNGRVNLGMIVDSPVYVNVESPDGTINKSRSYSVAITDKTKDGSPILLDAPFSEVARLLTPIEKSNLVVKGLEGAYIPSTRSGDWVSIPRDLALEYLTAAGYVEASQGVVKDKKPLSIKDFSLAKLLDGNLANDEAIKFLLRGFNLGPNVRVLADLEKIADDYLKGSQVALGLIAESFGNIAVVNNAGRTEQSKMFNVLISTKRRFSVPYGVIRDGLSPEDKIRLALNALPGPYEPSLNSEDWVQTSMENAKKILEEAGQFDALSDGEIPGINLLFDGLLAQGNPEARKPLLRAFNAVN